MGAGKSAVGRQLAKLLHLEFIDSDEEIETRTGVDIPFIFEKEGEEGFRKREVKVIDELSQKEGVVLATGGGADRLGPEIAGVPVQRVVEFDAWARGAPILAERESLELPDRYLLVSLGTGTSVLAVEDGACSRVGGSATSETSQSWATGSSIPPGGRISRGTRTSSS